MIDDQDLAGLDPYELMATEASRLDQFFTGASASDWKKPTRCEGWSVRDVMGHLAGSEEYNTACLADEVGALFTGYAQRGVTDVTSFNAAGVSDRRDRPFADVLEREKAEAQDRGLKGRGDHGTDGPGDDTDEDVTHAQKHLTLF